MEDCVIRALSLGLALPYDEIVNMLNENSIKYKCDPINQYCYSCLLKNYPKFNTNKKIGRIASEHPKSVLIIRTDGHLTCSIDGIVYDTWDCTDKEATCYWIIC